MSLPRSVRTTAGPSRGIDRPAVRLYSRVGLFYGLAIAIPWALWTAASLVSRAGQGTAARWVTSGLGLAGLASPMLTAAALIRRDPRLRRDVIGRMTAPRGTALAWAAVAIALMPIALLAATAVSVACGGSTEQFELNRHSAVMIGTIPGWVTITLAPLLEELAWHGYGTDALTARWSLWRTTWAFTVFWALWHAPLAGIRGSYQAEVTDTGPLAGANFLLSLLLFTILMNWLYCRCGRSIWIAVLFHLCANVGNELFRTSPGTKVIQTLILVPVCIWVLWHDRALFLTRPETQ